MLCVPEPPEVSEIVNGSELIRVIPMPELYRKISEKYLLPLGYRGNNLLCSDWSAEDPGGIDYNGVFEYFYEMEYGGVFPMERYRNGVPAEEFEALMMEYLPVDTGQLREWAAYDEESGTYAWNRLGCGNYSPSYFGTSVPEVTDLRENEDGTVTLTVEAVCGMVIADDAVITHEVTMRFEEDGSFQYLGNRILDDGIQNIPGYSYRISSRFPDQTTQIK